MGGHPPDLAVQQPGAVHLQMRVDAGVADADEQVLAAAEHLVDRLPGEVDGGELRHPDVAARERLARERLAQLGCGAEDGVAFWHAVTVPAPREVLRADVGCEVSITETYSGDDQSETRRLL